jgi:peptidyl-prolyl cis-trans isomerase B (cyclophilin B)
VVSNKQRQRQLARAKWERQQSRRQAHDQRTRRFQLVAGTVVGLIAAAALVWVVVWVVQQEDERTPDQVTPTDGEFPSFITTPPGTSLPQTTPATPDSPGGSPTNGSPGGSPADGGQPNTTAPNTTGGIASTPTQGTP